MKTTDEIIEYLYPGAKDVNKRRPTAYDMIQLKKEISRIIELPYSSFNNNTRKRIHVKSRQLLAVVLKIFTNYSLSEIGYEISNKDHATVLWAIKQVANLHQTERKFRETFDKVIYAAEKLFSKNRFPRPIRKEQGLVSKELWKYAIKLAMESDHVKEPKPIPITPFRDRNEIIKLKEILQDKERELRLIRSQLERSRIKNSYEYVD